MNTYTDLFSPERLPKTSELRILIISDAIDNRNGVGTYYCDLTQHLAAHVDQIEMISPKPGTREDCSTIRFPVPGDPTQKIWMPDMRSMIRRIREVSPHLIIVGTPGPFGVVGMSQARWRKIPVLFGFHTRYEKLFGNYLPRIPSWLGKKGLARINRQMFRWNDATLAISPEMAECAQEAGAENTLLVGTPLNPDFLSTPLAAFSTKVNNVLYAGRLTEEKNISAFLEACRNMPEVDFFIAGDGEMKPMVLAAGAQCPNLNYLGWVSRRKLVSIIDSVDLFTLPSHEEAFGTVALESLCRRKNVLVSARCGITQWPQLRPGLFVLKENEPLNEAINRVIATPAPVRQEMAELGMQAARKVSGETIQHWLDILKTYAAP